MPYGVLWELPFQALIVGRAGRAADGGVPLLEQAKVSFAPSLAFPASQTPPKHGKRAKSARLLAFGASALNPSAKRTDMKPAPSTGPKMMDDELRPLPDVERQLRLLGKLYGPAEGQVFTGRGAHEATFKRLAGAYDILHLATHGLYNDGAPLYSRLLLSQAELVNLVQTVATPIIQRVLSRRFGSQVDPADAQDTASAAREQLTAHLQSLRQTARAATPDEAPKPIHDFEA